MHDWQWGMPAENWGQTGSYIGPALPPLEDPDAGTLVQLPCINRDYLPLLLGCCDQLRNPSSWDPSIGDNGLSLALNKWSKLRQMLGASIGVACVPPVQYRFTADCHLQTSSDGGATWVTVPGWDENLDGCVKAHIPPIVPPNPRATPVNQNACNIAGFLSQELIQRTMQAIDAHFTEQENYFAIANQIMGDLAFAFPITAAGIQAISDFVTIALQQLQSQVHAASTDPALWSDVTCIIYNAIKVDGYVTGGNFATVQANLNALVYAQAWVHTALSNFWGSLGLQNIEAMQAVGSLDDVDCSNCGGNWCFEWDFRVSPGPWVADICGNGYGGQWVNGVGWVSTDNPPNGRQEVAITFNLPRPIFISAACVFLISPDGTGGNPRQWYVRNPNCVSVFTLAMPPDPCPAGCSQCASPIGAVGTQVQFFDSTTIGSGREVLQKLHLEGTGPNPFGVDNCTF